jgi:hypothetical protein
MNSALRLFKILLILSMVLLLGTECSDREMTAMILSDSTILYPSHDTGKINAGITLCRSVKKNGKRIGTGTVFTIREEESVRACIDLTNCRFEEGRSLMFHIDWMDGDDNSIFMKRIDLSPADSATTLMSSLSVSPGKREPGSYKVRIYLFREMISEKIFRLISEAQAESERLKAKLTLCRSMDKTTGERIGTDTVFTIGDKEKIRAFADITDPGKRIASEMTFLFDWTDTTGKSLYRKEIMIASLDSAGLLTSAISISPENREPGEYILKLYLSDEVVAEQKFEIRAAPVVVKPKKPEIRASIILCRGTDKKTGEPSGIDSVFVINENEKVKAFADILNPGDLDNHKLEFYFDWADVNGKSFYRKQIDIAPGDSIAGLNSTISIAPGKREPGIYTCRLFLSREKIAEKKFSLK